MKVLELKAHLPTMKFHSENFPPDDPELYPEHNNKGMTQENAHKKVLNVPILGRTMQRAVHAQCGALDRILYGNANEMEQQSFYIYL